MKALEPLATLKFYPKGDPRRRLFALWFFATLITVWWIGGVLVLGFEQSWLQFLVAAGVSLFLQWLFMWVHVRSFDLRAPWKGGFVHMVNFLVPAYPPGIAIAMLMYANDRLWPIVFACCLAIGSKALFRAPVAGGGSQHFFNPSNFAITVTLFLFPAVGLAPPYHFTENVTGVWDWIIPAAVLFTGVLVHALSTGRLPLIMAWLIGFVAQGLLRAWFYDTPMLAPLAPMTSVGFILFTLYMMPDPGTTPLQRNHQLLFGFSVALVYALLQVNHVVFGLILSLTLVCGMRGVGMTLGAWVPGRRGTPVAAKTAVSAERNP